MDGKVIQKTIQVTGEKLPCGCVTDPDDPDNKGVWNLITESPSVVPGTVIKEVIQQCKQCKLLVGREARVERTTQPSILVPGGMIGRG